MSEQVGFLTMGAARAAGEAPDAIPADPWAAAAAAAHERSLRDDAPADGPRTIVDPDVDLKTAFFLPDTGVGPAAADPVAPPAPPRKKKKRSGRRR